MNTAETTKPPLELVRGESAKLLDDDREEFAKNIFQTVREPLVALDANLRVWLANHAFYQTFQVTRPETEKRLIFDLGNGQWNIPRLRELLEEIIPEDESFNDFEVEHDFERIGRKIMLLNARRINNGRLVLLAIEDITERRRLENELQTFAQIAAHDLKEPLRMVSQYLGLVERRLGKTDKETSEYIHFAVDGAGRMKKLIENLLAHSAVGKQRSLAPVDLNEAFRNSTSNLRRSISEAAARVTSDKLPTLTGDSTEFEQLLQNLIANGIKYRGVEAPKVHISVVKRDKEWLFKVEDNGIGIKVEDQKLVFDAFRRLHTKAEYSGTGLGLATCKKIVESHGGRIWVESEPGRGSAFFFTIPAEI